MAVSSPLLAIALLLTSLYSLCKWTTRFINRYRLKKENGCLPPQKLSQKDPILGTDVVLANLAAARKFGFLDLLNTRHANIGRTFTTNTFFRTTINTCDPRVIQSVLSLQFDDFGMGPLRRKSASPLLGRGIFTTDNELWSHQRALIRPSFVRSQVTDFCIFESHVDQLIQLIARENYVVDLQHLLFRMVSRFSFLLYTIGRYNLPPSQRSYILTRDRYLTPTANTCLENLLGSYLLMDLVPHRHSMMLSISPKKAPFSA